MRIFKTWLALFSTAYFFSCGPCGNADPPVSDYSFTFQIQDKSTGDNLLFGPTATLDLEEFKLYSLLNTDTLFYPLIPSQDLGWASEPGSVYTEIRPPASELILQYPDKTKDILFLTFSQSNSECWGLTTRITSVTRNETEFFESVYEALIFSR